MTQTTPRTALVTGATSGIGLATAHRLLTDGWRVAASGRDADQLDQLVSAYPDRCVALRADLMDDAQAGGLVDRAVEALGCLDGLVHAAGVLDDAAALSLDWSPLAARMSRAQQGYVLGRGPAFAIANECALKLKETCGLHAEAYSAAEVLHGPSAIVQAHFPVLALAVEDAAQAGVVQTAERLAAQGADVFVTGAEAKGCTTLPSVGGLHPLVAPLVLAVGFYGFVEALARRRGFDPDTPPHLRKVTETV